MRWFLSDANVPVYFFQDCGKHCFMTLNFLPHTFQHRLLDFSKTCTVALLGISSREVSYRLFLCRCKCPACFMLVSCLFHACTCGKGPEALLTHDSYLSKSEELLLNIGQRRLKPWNNMLYCSCVPTWRVGFQQMSNEIVFRAETSPAPWLAIAKVGTPEIPSSTGAPPKNFSKYFSQIRKAEQPQAQTEKFTGPKKRYIKKKNLKSTEFGTI